MRCGFANPSHLTTAFKQELGLTPTAYRRALASSS
ncbi:MAG: AraC family transcriptional regulator [Pseudomonadota bacterium]